MLGLRIHFLYFKSTQCFQNMFFYQFVHSFESILGVRENFHSIHPSGVYTFFFKNWLWSMNFFRRRVGNHLFSKACRFLARQLIFSFSTFFLTCLLLFSYLLSFSFHFLFFSIFIFMMIFLFILHICFRTMSLNEKLYTVPEFQTSLIVMIYKH